MFETTGSLAFVQPVMTLVGLVALPLLWTILALAARRPPELPREERAGRAGGFDDGVLGPMVAISAALGTLGLALVLATRLFVVPRGYGFVQHVAQLGRIGQLDLALDLALEPRSAVFAVVIAVVACGSTLHTTWSTRPGGGGILGWTGLVTTGAMLTVVGDGLLLVLVGLGLLSIGAWGLARGGGERSGSATALAGTASVLLGSVFLFWSLGGTFGPNGYEPDGAPRFVLVATASPSDVPHRATLVMTGHAGSLVTSDDQALPHEPLEAPFSVTVDPGVYTLRIRSGAASSDVVVPRVGLSAGQSHVLTPYGPTTSLRALDDQLSVPRLGPGGVRIPVQAMLASRTIGGLRASAIVLLLVAGGALAHVFSLARRRGISAVASVLEAIPLAYLGLRIAPLVDPTSADGALVAVLGAGSGVMLAANAACVDDPHNAVRAVLGAVVSIALAATGVGDPAASLVLSSAAIVGAAGSIAAIDARRDVRWLGVACAATVGLLPGAGASAGFMQAVSAALASATTGTSSWALFAAAVAVAVVGSAMLVSLAAFRVYDAVLRASVRDPGTSRAQGAVSVVLAIVALAGGTMFGAGTSPFGGAVVPLARRLVAVAVGPPPRGLGVGAVALSILAAGGGVVLARRASEAPAPPGWLLVFGRPYAILAWAGSVVGDAARFLERSVHAMDRDVVEDVPAAIGDVWTRIARLVRRSPSIDAAASDAARPREGLVTAVLVATLALLGAVVVSSLVLR